MSVFRKQIQPVLQVETTECGLACLSMLLHWHGRSISLHELRSRYPAQDSGVNLEKLIQIGGAEGFSSRALRLELTELQALQLPCLLHWDYNHYVVLERVTHRGCWIVDPAAGRRRYKKAELDQHFTGIALEVTPALDFKKAPAVHRLALRNFIPNKSQLSSYLSQIIGLSVVLQGLALLGPYYIQTVVDDVLARGDQEFLLLLALGFVLVLLLEVLLSALRSWTSTVFGQRLSFTMASSLLEHLLKLPISWFYVRNTGDIASRFSSFEALRGFLTQGVAAGLIDGAMALCFVVIMFIYSPQLTLVVVLSVILYLLLRLGMFRRQKEANEEHLVASAKQSSLFLESIKQINTLKGYGAEGRRGRQWQKAYSTEVNSSLRIARLSLTFGQAQSALFGLENIGVIYLGAQNILAAGSGASTALTVGMLYAFIAYKNQFKDRVSGLVNHLIEFRLLRVHLERLGDIALSPTESLNENDRVQAPHADAALLQIADLSFSYGEGPAILANTQLTLGHSQSAFVSGPSGSGKSTLLKLISRQIPLQDGSITLNGHALPDCPLSVWRSMVAAVTQEDGLLAGSIADNVTMFSATTREPDVAAKLERLAELTGLTPLIAMLPLGWDTQLGELGIALSAGQQQRVLIARALFKEPTLLILDEATAHLDEAAEAAIFDGLRQLKMAFIAVSHRSTIAQFTDVSLTLAAAPSQSGKGHQDRPDSVSNAAVKRQNEGTL